MGIGPRQVPNVAEALPPAAIKHKVRLVPTELITEDSPELNEDIGGGIAFSGSLIDWELHYSAVLPVADILYEERVVPTPMVTEESPLANEGVAGSIATLVNPTQVVKLVPDLQEPVQLTQPSLDNAVFSPDASDPIQPAIIPQNELGRILLTTDSDAGKFAKDCEAEEEVAAPPSGNLPPWICMAEIFETKEKKEEAGTSPGKRPKNLSRQESKRTDRPLSHFEDGLEGKSAEPELPKFRKGDSASNSPAAVSCPPGNQSIRLRKPSLPAELDVIRRTRPWFVESEELSL